MFLLSKIKVCKMAGKPNPELIMCGSKTDDFQISNMAEIYDMITPLQKFN